MWADKLCPPHVLCPDVQKSVCGGPSVPAPVLLLTHVQVVVFGVEWSTFSRLSDAGVTARLRLLYVIFMVVASRRRWGPERVQLGEDRLPPPLLFNGDVCETSSNKLTISGELGVGGGVCVCAPFCTRADYEMTSSPSRLRLEAAALFASERSGLGHWFLMFWMHIFSYSLFWDQRRFFLIPRTIYPPPATLNCVQMTKKKKKKSKWCELLDGRR